ncbi:MAG TPA: hypothetical protein VH300_10050 [Thermoleophilaceae bacterium]|nr:hypothetical protein [Thermoleophilaceae bacterium]
MRRAIVAGRSQGFSMALAEPRTRGRGARFAARAEALATRRNATLAAVLAGLVVLVLFFGLRTYPNYDSYYQLLWGQELAHGHLPDYNVFRAPTPHPLSELVGFLLSPFGLAADRLLVLLTLVAWVGLLWAIYRFTKHLLGTLVAAVAVLVMLTRTDLEFFALRGVVDIWFLFFVFTAAALEVHRPRRGMPVMLLLVLAGLLRPEAWVLAGLYVLWLFPQKGIRGIWPYVLLAAAAPVLWLAWDWIVTGKPLYSLSSTRETAGEFQRNRGVVAAVKSVPDYVGANEKIVNVVIGGLGSLGALWMLRRRAYMPLALMAIGLATFLAIAAAGLSVIPRYLAIPSILFNLGVAVGLTGWLVVKEPRRAHRLFVALFVFTLLVGAWRTIPYSKDFRKLHGQENFVRGQHTALKAILDDPKVVPLLNTCRPITTPTHSAIPVVRFETGLPKEAFQASIAQARPPGHGLLLIGNTFNFEPSAARSTSGVSERSARKWWSNYPLSTFRFVSGNSHWRVYKNC